MRASPSWPDCTGFASTGFAVEAMGALWIRQLVLALGWVSLET